MPTLSLPRTAVAKKAIMALTGVILFGWLLAHLAGNLKVYQSAEKFNHYAEFLRIMGSPLVPEGGLLWLSRLVLLLSVALHIWSATSLTLTNRRARPLGYESLANVQADYAARTMRYSGYLIAIYIVYHLMHLTLGNAHHDFHPADPYHNLVSGFQQPLVALVYVIANLLLGLHLYHGLWSMFQSLGLSHPAYRGWRRTFAVVFASLMTLGFLSIPLGVMAGLVE